MRKNSVKNTRINAEVKRELSVLLRDEVADPRIPPMTTVVEASVTPDLKYCTVYVSVMGTDETVKETLGALKHCSGFLRKRLAETVNLRNTPQLIFRADRSIEYGVHMSHLIEEVISSDEEARARRAESEEAGEDLKEDGNGED